jgi:hypothetical protein
MEQPLSATQPISIACSAKTTRRTQNKVCSSSTTTIAQRSPVFAGAPLVSHSAKFLDSHVECGSLNV